MKHRFEPPGILGLSASRSIQRMAQPSVATGALRCKQAVPGIALIDSKTSLAGMASAGSSGFDSLQSQHTPPAVSFKSISAIMTLHNSVKDECLSISQVAADFQFTQAQGQECRPSFLQFTLLYFSTPVLPTTKCICTSQLHCAV